MGLEQLNILKTNRIWCYGWPIPENTYAELETFLQHPAAEEMHIIINLFQCLISNVYY